MPCLEKGDGRGTHYRSTRFALPASAAGGRGIVPLQGVAPPSPPLLPPPLLARLKKMRKPWYLVRPSTAASNGTTCNTKPSNHDTGQVNICKPLESPPSPAIIGSGRQPEKPMCYKGRGGLTIHRLSAD